MYWNTNHRPNLASKLRLHLRQRDKCSQRSPKMRIHHWHSLHAEPCHTNWPARDWRSWFLQPVLEQGSPQGQQMTWSAYPYSQPLLSLPPKCAHTITPSEKLAMVTYWKTEVKCLYPRIRIIPIQTPTIPVKPVPLMDINILYPPGNRRERPCSDIQYQFCLGWAHTAVTCYMLHATGVTP